MKLNRASNSSTPKLRMLSTANSSAGKLNLSRDNRRLTPRDNITLATQRRLNVTNRTVLLSTPMVKPKQKDDEFICDILYNDYLQASLRKKILEETVGKHDCVLNEQLIFQKETLHASEATFKSVLSNIDDLQKQNDVVEMFKILEKNVEELNHLFKKYEIKTYLSRMSHKLNSECDKVIIRDVKPISNQEEMDALVSGIKNSLVLTEKLIEFGGDNDQVKELADALRTHTSLLQEAKNQILVMQRMEEEMTFEQLKLCSDYFSENA